MREEYDSELLKGVNALLHRVAVFSNQIQRHQEFHT